MGRCKQPTQWEEEKNNVSCDLLPGVRTHAPQWGKAGGEGPFDKSPCCRVSLTVLLVNNVLNFIYMYIYAILSSSPWPLLTGT